MANEWMSALPSAWKAPDFGTVAQAAKTGADAALSRQQAVGAAVSSESANQERIRKQALQDVMAKSIKTTLGPNGKLIHVFDNDRFMANIATSPAAMDAYDKYQAVVYPQAGKEAVQRGVVLDANGGVDARGTLQEAGRSPYALDIARAGQTLQKEQAGLGAEIAQSRQLTGTLATEGPARAGTLVGTDQMQPKSLDQLGTGVSTANTVTPEQIKKLSPATLAAAKLNLRAAGHPLPDNATAEDIAKAANAAAASEVQAGLGGIKSFSDLPASVWNTNMTAGKTTQGVLGKIFGGELDTQAKKTALTRAETETQGITRGVANVEATAKSLLIPVEKIGNTVSPEAQERVRAAESAVKALGNLDTGMRDLVAQIDGGKINPNTPEGNRLITSELVAQLGVLSQIYGGTSTEGGIGRALKDIGAPADLGEAIQHGGANAAISSWLSNKSVNIRDLLKDAPKRAAISVRSVLTDAKSSNPTKVLRDAGYGHLLPASLAPSAWSKGPADAKPGRRKATAADFE